jgi:hypothetical protein
MFKKQKSRLFDTAPNISTFVGQKNLKLKLISKFFAKEERFVRVSGKAGVGKSALACHTLRWV